MIDETQGTTSWSTPPPGAATAPAAFCQDCGRALAPGEEHRIGASVFCAPCLQQRAVAPPPAPTANAPVPPASASEPSPVIAGILGLIPGVGAMYNGQIVKGFVHIVVFAICVSLSDQFNGIFGLFVAGWVFYQVFDAVHTAIARRDGLPLPNYLNLNNLGEHFQHTTGSAPRPTAVPPTPAAPAAEPYPPQPPAAAWTPVPPAANWAGYIPPSAFAAPAAAAPQYTVPVQDAGLSQPMLPARCFPVGAVVLIGFGLVFLLINFVPSIDINGSWVPALLLLIVAAMMSVRRAQTVQLLNHSQPDRPAYTYLQAFRAPLVLTLLAVLFVLQAAHVVRLDHSWPVILIVAGVLLFAERAMRPTMPIPFPQAAAPTPAPAPGNSLLNLNTPQEGRHE